MTNLDIAQAATIRPIREVAQGAGLSESDFESYGNYKGKLTAEGIQKLQNNGRQGKLVLVTAVTPTPHGEGKTTTSVGLAQGLCQIGERAVPAIREAALGPVFGVKGGAAGGGYSQVLPMEDINLFFTGDFPAISAAHNLFAALIDAHIHNGNALDLDVRQIFWPRTVDMNDRALREITVGLGGKANGFPREDGFVITPASEVMAALCLASSFADLKERLGRMIAGLNRAGKPVTAKEVRADGAMAALLRDAIRPNIAQTIEGGPAFVHGGPFANIAHGCSTLMATRCGLGLADYTITEAGFASDLGAEKFMDLVCPSLGRGPNAVVLVATVRALKHHGGGDDLEALHRGLENMRRHIRHLKNYGPPVLVSINAFPTDTAEENEAIIAAATAEGVKAVCANPWGGGGPQCTELAKAVKEACERPSTWTPLYSREASFTEKVGAIVQKAYGGEGVTLSPEASKRLKWCEDNGLGNLPVCVAKTQYSLSDDPKAVNSPTGFKVNIREIRPSAGAGFLVAVAGDIMLMPGLGKTPAAFGIDVDQDGKITGLF